MTDTNPIYGPFFGVMGAASAIIFSGMYQLPYFVWTVNSMNCPDCRVNVNFQRSLVDSDEIALVNNYPICAECLDATTSCDYGYFRSPKYRNKPHLEVM